MRAPDKRWWVVAALVATVALFHAFDLGRFLGVDALKQAQADLEAWRDARPLLAPAAYFALYVLVTALSLPGAAVMTLAGGALFGLGWGTLIVSFASTLGATLAFLASRWLLGDWVRARFGPRLAPIDRGMAREGGFYLFTLRLVPAVPFFLVNLAMGLTRIRPWTFYWVSQVGMLAGTLVYVNAGTQLARIDSLAGIASPAVIASLSLLGVFPWAAHRLASALQRRRGTGAAPTGSTAPADAAEAPSPARFRRPRSFDRNLVVIGGGSAGLVAAYVAATVKAKVTLVEANRLGGDCLNTGCVPSKALIRTARLLSQMRRAPEFGIAGARADFRFADAMARVQRIVAAIEPHDSAARFRALGVDVVEGRAHIVTPWCVEIARHDGAVQRLTTRAIVVAAGAEPVVPPIPGLDAVEVLTSDNVWQLRELPPRLLVLGGGPIGCELAQAFARLGSRVTQVETLPRLLTREDPDVSALVAERFRAEGIDVRVGHEALRVEAEGAEKALVAAHGGREVRLAFDAILVAVGRAANLQGYGLEALGVATGRTVACDGWLRTSVPSIYAAGDVAGPYPFTHTASHQAWHAAVNALFAPFARFRVDDRVVPWTTFVDPEVARVGLSETEARERGVPVEVTRFPLADLDRAIADGETDGFVKVLTVPGKDRLLGVTIVGAHAGELIAEYVLAMRHGIGLNGILRTIHVYPTFAEANKHAAGRWKLDHAPQRLLRWAERFHRWRRGRGSA